MNWTEKGLKMTPFKCGRLLVTILLNAGKLRLFQSSSFVVLTLGPSFNLAMDAKISTIKSAAATEVVSATESYGGLTSTTSAPTKWIPSRPLMNRFNSRVVQPPDSGVPVAGAILGSSTDGDKLANSRIGKLEPHHQYR